MSPRAPGGAVGPRSRLALCLASLLAACASRAAPAAPVAEPAVEPTPRADVAPVAGAGGEVGEPPAPVAGDDEDHAEEIDDEQEFDHTLGKTEKIDPFGATPEEVVEQMLALAEVGKRDVVYDLGSGDGRIPIAAARMRGARGVGVELRSELVEESRVAAKKAGVSRRVRFIEGDIFKVDIREATVVMLYLYPRTNLALRPRLLTDLRPGTRIVAFDYGIEGWPRDKEEPVPSPYNPADLDYGHLYYYVVPANVSGVWQGAVALGSGARVAFTLHLDQTFQQVTGKAVLGDEELALEDLAIRGGTLGFSLRVPGARGDGALSFAGTVSGDRLKGTARPAGATRGGASWSATRDPDTRSPIDPSLAVR